MEGLSIHTVLNYERIRVLIDQGSAQRCVAPNIMLMAPRGFVLRFTK